MRTIRTKIVRCLTRLAIRQVVRFDRALAGRKKGIPSRVPKNPAQARTIEWQKTYLRQKRKTGTSYRPKRTHA